MKIILLILFLCFNLIARESMQAISSASPSIVQSYASGVCSLGLNKAGNSCCTGFRIGEDTVMTNYHCLVCISPIYKKIVDATPFMMEPSELLYSIGNAPLKVRQEIIQKANLDPEFAQFNLSAQDIPKNNQQLVSLLNRFQDSLGNINFETRIDNNEIEKSALKIDSLVQAQNRLDMVVIRVKNIKEKNKILTLSYDLPIENDLLAVIGHPHGGPQLDMKSYDLTDKCKVKSRDFDSPTRDHVFTHMCDTLPGNSGSPLINRRTGEVIGLHWGKNEAFNVNLGIQMREILNSLDFNL